MDFSKLRRGFDIIAAKILRKKDNVSVIIRRRRTNMDHFNVRSIGEIAVNSDYSARISIDAGYRGALAGINGFSWINVIWWAHLLDSPEQRSIVEVEKPYREGPDRLGIFATRSPLRPNRRRPG